MIQIALVVVIGISAVITAVSIWMNCSPRTYWPAEARMAHWWKGLRDQEYRAQFRLQIHQSATGVSVIRSSDTTSITAIYPVRGSRVK